MVDNDVPHSLRVKNGVLCLTYKTEETMRYATLQDTVTVIEVSRDELQRMGVDMNKIANWYCWDA